MIAGFDKSIADYANDKTLASALILITALIAITPLCGYLFACGCTWPGLGLDSACNIHDRQALHRCPWCASSFAGWLSFGFAAAAGVLVSAHPFFSSERRRMVVMLFQTLAGVVAFAVMAAIAAMISASVHKYPVGWMS